MCKFLHFHLMLAGFESKAWLAPLLRDESENECCKILTKMKLEFEKKKQKRVIDLLFKFRIKLNASYLDAKRVRSWEMDENPLRPKSGEEAWSNPRSPPQIAALTLLNITLLCSELYWRTSNVNGAKLIGVGLLLFLSGVSDAGICKIASPCLLLMYRSCIMYCICFTKQISFSKK